MIMFLPSATVVAERLCFDTCLSVILFTRGGCEAPSGQTLPALGRHIYYENVLYGTRNKRFEFEFKWAQILTLQYDLSTQSYRFPNETELFRRFFLCGHIGAYSAINEKILEIMLEHYVNNLFQD